MFNRDRIPSITQEEWSEIANYLRGATDEIRLGEMAKSTKVAADAALAVLDCLAIDNVVELYTIVFHRRCSSIPWDRKPMVEGFFDFMYSEQEWVPCRHCGWQAHHTELGYDILAKVLTDLPSFHG